jgi:hypothetical protein
MSEFSSLGFKDTPAFQEGYSPFTCKVNLVVSTDVNSYEVDFMDGSPVVKGDFVKDAEYGNATLVHTYTYTKGDSKYGSHTFYPYIKIFGFVPDGSNVPVSNEFNTAVTGRSLSIIVKDAAYNQ